MRLRTACPVCSKPLDLKSECKILDSVLREYKCGHSFLESAADTSHAELDLTSCTGTKQAFDFQKDGIEFVFKTDFNCLIADPMGLGKTIQSLLAARNAKDRFKHILVLVKSATQYQWFYESKEWYDAGLWSTYLIKGSKNFIPPGFNIYILSMDTLSRLTKSKDGTASLKALDIDLVIVDECHSFKNPDSARSQALVAFLQDISQADVTREIDISCPMCRAKWTESTTIKINLRQNQSNITSRHYTNCKQCGSRVVVGADHTSLNDTQRKKGLILLSGTPIKNRADEYFIPLNLLKPEVFTSQARFRSRWLVKDFNGKYNRISPYMIDEFRELTSNFIIRREKNEVLSLPPFRRTFQYIQSEDENFKKAYNKALQELERAVESDGCGWMNVEPHLITLRRIIGMAKCDAAIEHVEEFIETTEDEKIAIGIHHEAVRDRLFYEFQTRGYNPLKLSGEDSAERKSQIQNLWLTDSSRRVAVINMLAGGVGLNLQLPQCQTAIGLERQWNAADEEQFEARFFGRGAVETMPKNFLIEYIIASGTYDQWFTDLVESKRQICGETLDGWNLKSDSDSLKDLVHQTLQGRL